MNSRDIFRCLRTIYDILSIFPKRYSFFVEVLLFAITHLGCKLRDEIKPFSLCKACKSCISEHRILVFPESIVLFPLKSYTLNQFALLILVMRSHRFLGQLSSRPLASGPIQSVFFRLKVAVLLDLGCDERAVSTGRKTSVSICCRGTVKCFCPSNHDTITKNEFEAQMRLVNTAYNHGIPPSN